MMLRPLTRPAWTLCRRPIVAFPLHSNHHRWYRTTSGKVSDPLRILFCGQDRFSVEALKALREEMVNNRALIDSINVVSQPPKRVGRGRKHLGETPCMTTAQDLGGMVVHELKDFKGWELPKGINLIVAVSFGLFIPPRLIRRAKYGGLNCHPSFLPDLRGPAPIHHAIIRGDEHMGASLQTLHEEKFDHGVVLAQTSAPGLRIIGHPPLPEVTQKLALECAELLVKGLREGLHVPPHVDASWKAKELEGKPLKHAPKITKADLEIDWDNWTAADWARRLQLSKGIWSVARLRQTRKTTRKPPNKRVLFHDVMPVPPEEISGRRWFIEWMYEGKNPAPVSFEREVVRDLKTGNVYVHLPGDAWVWVQRATVAGKDARPAGHVLGEFLIPIEDPSQAMRIQGEICPEPPSEILKRSR